MFGTFDISCEDMIKDDLSIPELEPYELNIRSSQVLVHLYEISPRLPVLQGIKP